MWGKEEALDVLEGSKKVMMPKRYVFLRGLDLQKLGHLVNFSPNPLCSLIFFVFLLRHLFPDSSMYASSEIAIIQPPTADARTQTVAV